MDNNQLWFKPEDEQQATRKYSVDEIRSYIMFARCFKPKVRVLKRRKRGAQSFARQRFPMKQQRCSKASIRVCD